MEAKDARKQDCAIMELVELSDMYGAIELYIEKKFGLTMDDLKTMSEVTQRAFKKGQDELRKTR